MRVPILHRLRCLKHRLEYLRPRIYRGADHHIFYGPMRGGDNLRFVMHVDGKDGCGGDVWVRSDPEPSWSEWGRLRLSRREWWSNLRYALLLKD